MSDSEKFYAGLHESFQEGVLATFNLFWVYASPLFYLSLLSLFFNYITFFSFFFLGVRARFMPCLYPQTFGMGIRGTK